MWVRLIHLAQQQQRNTYKIIKFHKGFVDSKWEVFTNFVVKGNERLAMMKVIIGLVTETPGQGILDQMGMG